MFGFKDTEGALIDVRCGAHMVVAPNLTMSMLGPGDCVEDSGPALPKPRRTRRTDLTDPCPHCGGSGRVAKPEEDDDGLPF